MNKLRIATMLLMGFIFAMNVHSQPRYSESMQKETLKRALTAVSMQNGKTFLSCRYFEGDNEQYHYELFHNGTKIGTFNRTNYIYPIESDAADQ